MRVWRDERGIARRHCKFLKSFVSTKGVKEMADVLNDYAISLRCDFILGIAHPNVAPSLMLFVNDETITCASLLTDLTECTAGGYARITLVPGNWTLDSSTPCIIEGSYGACVFTLTDNGGGQIIYGHAVVDTVGDEILWAQLWTTPFTIPAGGGVVEVFPFWTEEQCSG